MARDKKPRRLYFQKYFKKHAPYRQTISQDNMLSDDGVSDIIASLLEQDPIRRIHDFIETVRPEQKLVETPLAPHVILLSSPGSITHTLMREFATARHEAVLAILPPQSEVIPDQKRSLSDMMRNLIGQQGYAFPLVSPEDHKPG